jgi:phenylalanine-4-hydroxylase
MFVLMDERILQIANKIKELRLEAGYGSYEVFAWDNEIPRIQYWRMEKGTNFTISSLLRVLDAHKISLEDFFEEINEQ